MPLLKLTRFHGHPRLHVLVSVQESPFFPLAPPFGATYNICDSDVCPPPCAWLDVHETCKYVGMMTLINLTNFHGHPRSHTLAGVPESPIFCPLPPFAALYKIFNSGAPTTVWELGRPWNFIGMCGWLLSSILPHFIAIWDPTHWRVWQNSLLFSPRHPLGPCLKFAIPACRPLHAILNGHATW